MKRCIDEGILQSYGDGELTRELTERVEFHLSGCTNCALAFRQLENESLLFSQAIEPDGAMNVPTARLRHRIDAEIARIEAGAMPVPATSQALNARRISGRLEGFFALWPRHAIGYAGLTLVIAFTVLVSAVYWKRVPNISQVKPETPSATSSSQTSEISPVPGDSVRPATGEDKRLDVRAESVRRSESRRWHPGKVLNRSARLLPGEQSFLKILATLDAAIKSNKLSMRPGLQVEYEQNLAMVDHAIATTRDAARKNPADAAATQFMLAAYQSKADFLSQVAQAQALDRQR